MIVNQYFSLVFGNMQYLRINFFKKMRKLLYFCAFSLFLTFTMGISSCKTGEGCPAEQQDGASGNKKKARLHLFDKNMRKKMK
jgi:hypothetical protein